MQKIPVDVKLAAVSWTQLLVLITAVDKTDLRKIPNIIALLSPGKHDWTQLGSAAVALNVLAASFFVFPLLHYIVPRKSDPQREHFVIEEGRYASYLGIAGYLCWVLSTLLFFVYLNPLFAVLAVVAIIIGLVTMAWGPKRRPIKPQQKFRRPPSDGAMRPPDDLCKTQETSGIGRK